MLEEEVIPVAILSNNGLLFDAGAHKVRITPEISSIFIALSLGLDLNVMIEQKRRNIGYLSGF
jgi:hypothetical protein